MNANGVRSIAETACNSSVANVFLSGLGASFYRAEVPPSFFLVAVYSLTQSTLQAFIADGFGGSLPDDLKQEIDSVFVGEVRRHDRYCPIAELIASPDEEEVIWEYASKVVQIEESRDTFFFTRLAVHDAYSFLQDPRYGGFIGLVTRAKGEGLVGPAGIIAALLTVAPPLVYGRKCTTEDEISAIECLAKAIMDGVRSASR